MYSDVVAGIQTALEPLPLQAVLDYEPTTIQAPPMAYILLVSWLRNQTGQVVTMRYTVTVRLVLLWQDNEQVEKILMEFVNSIPSALEVDMTLGAGPDDRRISQVLMGLAEYRDIGGITYRTMDVTVEVLEKGSAGSGL